MKFEDILGFAPLRGPPGWTVQKSRRIAVLSTCVKISQLVAEFIFASFQRVFWNLHDPVRTFVDFVGQNGKNGKMAKMEIIISWLKHVQVT